MIVSISFGSPSFSPAVFAASRATNSSAIGRSTMIRRADMQIWPWCRNAPNAEAVDRVVEVRVGEHDQRVRPAELEHAPA